MNCHELPLLAYISAFTADKRKDRIDVGKMVLRFALLQVGLGLFIGLPAAMGTGHLMTAELFGVKAWSPLVLGTTTAVLAAVALLAAVLPARRTRSSTFAFSRFINTKGETAIETGLSPSGVIPLGFQGELCAILFRLSPSSKFVRMEYINKAGKVVFPPTVIPKPE